MNVKRKSFHMCVPGFNLSQSTPKEQTFPDHPTELCTNSFSILPIVVVQVI